MFSGAYNIVHAIFLEKDFQRFLGIDMGSELYKGFFLERETPFVVGFIIRKRKKKKKRT